ncbi:hypothetical protein EQO05_01455 [Methanosarcina sp. MSH10X1]|jgi:hypothetical protein|nr:hypothetical protein EQO05_01455 [Methanosarcina sp. MSH10X1]
MLLSIISSGAIFSSSISVITTRGLPQYGATVVFGLIILLSLKEIISASKLWNKNLSESLNIAILPLFLIFVGIVIFKASSVI